MSGPRVTVVGAGIIGTCVAYELQRRGAEVTLIERDEPGRGASYGNSGAISEGSVMPLATPSVIAKAPAMLLDPNSPLRVPLGYLFRALPWLARFAAAARPAEIERISRALHALHRQAVEHHLALAADIGAAELVVRRGHLHLYPDAQALAGDQASWELRRRFGIAFERIDRAGIEALEPAIAPRYQVGMFLPDHAMVVNPLRYVQKLAAAFESRGGRLARDEVRALRPHPDGGWQIDAAARRDADHVVLAAGVWSATLLRPLGLSYALESQRGYHTMFVGMPAPISRTVVLTDHKIFATPMEEGLRAGGMVDIAGLRRPPDMLRAARIASLARESVLGLDGALERVWMGHRPCFPDTLPRVGQAPGLPGLWLAFGHGHLGLTDSANTARQIADELLAPAPERR
ncbi:MAG: FAD-dependent oxidoreductase [Burkholderiaceae bacterium]